MKKNFIYLLLLCSLIAQAQVTPSYPTIKLTKTIEGVKQDSLLVVGTDKTVKHIPSSKITSILEYTTASALPITGVAGKIYVTKDNGKIYRWNGTYYTELAITDISGKVDKVTGKSLLSDTEITRLATLSNYTHPANHPPSIITQDASNRFVTDAEKTAWNAKQSNLGYTPENVANKATTLTASSTLYPNNDAVIAGLATKEDKANKVTSIGSPANDTNYPSELAVKTYADNLVVGMLNDRGVWDASGNAFPTTGGSGVGGAIRKGDMWYVSVAGTLGAKLVNVGDSFRALVNDPAQVAANWSILEANIGYVPANDNAVVHLTGAETITGAKTFNDISAVTNYKSSTSSVIISDTDGLVFRGVRSGAWSDSVNTRFFQVGNSNDNVVFNTRLGSVANRMLFSSLKTQISSGNFASTIVPLGIFEVTNGTNRFFNVFGSGNSVFGGSPDDNINRLQITGTISSGTTTLGDTPPTANNQLTRKDYVDTGLAGREPSFTKNTAFNKNFGTTAGTVVEGNDSRILNGQTAFGWGNHVNGGYAFTTGSNINQASFRTALGLGSNAYTSTAFLPSNDGVRADMDYNTMLSPGFYNSSGSNTNNPIGQSYSQLIVARGVDTGFQIAGGWRTDALHFRGWGDYGSGFSPWRKVWHDGNFNPANYLPLSGGTLSGAISGTSATFSETVTASPATASNHVVVKSQLDAVANTIGSGGTFDASPLANRVNVNSFAIGKATYIRIGNIVTAQVEFIITPIASGLVAFDFTLPFARGINVVDAMGHGAGRLSGSVIPVFVSSSTISSVKVEMFTPDIYEMKISAAIQYDVTK